MSGVTAVFSQRPLSNASPAGHSSPSTSLLYCRLCGDTIVSGQRCRGCGGSRGQAPASQNLASLGRKSKGKGDPWAERYMPGIAPNDGCDENGGNNDEATSSQPTHTTPRNHDWRSSLTRNATAFNLGVGMPSSISKDLKASPTPSPLGSHATRQPSQRGNILPPTASSPASDTTTLPPLSPTHQHMPHSPSQPLMEHPAGGAVSKVCGTVLDPESSRNRWACIDCGVVFARDSTIYVPPASAVRSGATSDDEFYCKDCYTHKYSLGICAREECQKPILGTTKERGAFVKTSTGSLYHGTCFRCHACDRGGGNPPLGDGTEVMLDLQGLPSCEDCFGAKPRQRQAVEKQHHTAAAYSPSLGSKHHKHTASGSSFPFPAATNGKSSPTARPDLAAMKRSSYTAAGFSSPTGAKDKKMGATIAELSQRFGSLAGSNGNPNHSDKSGTITTATTSPTSQRPPSPSRSPQPRAAHFTRSDSFKGHYDLGAFKSSMSGSGSLARSDSRVRSRSNSPVKETRMGSAVDEPTRVSAETPQRTSKFPLPRNYSDAERKATSPGSGGPSPKAAQCSTTATAPVSDTSSASDEDSHIQKEEGKQIAPAPQDEDPALVSCAICHHDAFHGPDDVAREEALLVSLPAEVDGRPLELHAECFRCAICQSVIDAAKSFVRLDSHHDTTTPMAFAHPTCAPPVTWSRTAAAISTPPPSAPRTRTSITSATMHPTLRTVPRPSDGGEKREYVATHSFVRRAASIQKRQAASPTMTPTSPLNRGKQFKSTSGAAPPTRSTLNVHRPGQLSNPAAGMFAAGAAATGNATHPASTPTPTAALRRYGGMLTCAGCTGALTSLESVPGPAGSVWHKKCLVCRASPATTAASMHSAAPIGRFGAAKPKTCGKQLDSFAKVRSDGEVRCATCFREGR